jgi:Domain of unknown function (DU1801)
VGFELDGPRRRPAVPDWADWFTRTAEVGLRLTAAREPDVAVVAMIRLMADKGSATRNDTSVEDYLASLENEQTVKDSRVLIEMMQRVSGLEPKMWNVGTIGFGTYHYKYSSGREGDSATVSFYPRKDKMTIYLMDGTVRHSELLARLGKHTTSRVCVYIKRLSDIELPILEQIVRQSYEYVKSQDGHMHRALK